jgi:hypothetical protein
MKVKVTFSRMAHFSQFIELSEADIKTIEEADTDVRERRHPEAFSILDAAINHSDILEMSPVFENVTIEIQQEQ